MAPQLRVYAGTDPEHLTPITSLVNSGKAHHIKSDAFEGDVTLYLKDFGMNDDVGEHYFQSPERVGVTWSIQMQGRFLQPHTGDGILFGNTFDEPLNLPWGSGIVLALMSRADPGLEQDLYSSTKPWALSPLIASASYLSFSKDETPPPVFPPSSSPLKEDTLDLVTEDGDRTAYDTSMKRRAYFREVTNRKKTILDEQVTLTIDFCHGHLAFSPSLALLLPGGMQMDLARLWDGRQVRFVCCERRKPPLEDGEDVWGQIFWCVAFEPEKEDGGDEGNEKGNVQNSQSEHHSIPSDDID